MATQTGDAKRTLSTGDLVISVSEIFDRLQTKVDPNTLEQLLRDILAGRRNQVRPGELITAELINQILAELESLQVRITKLEAGGVVTTPVVPVPTPVDITDLLPHGTVRVGDDLTIVGKNFLEPAENNQVSVAGVDIAGSLFKLSSDEQHLIFKIPPVPNLASLSQPVKVEVKNKNGSDSASLTLLPAFNPPTGRIEVAYVIAPVMPAAPPEATKIQAAKPYVFTYSITAFVTADATEATYEVTPTMAGWNPKLLKESGDQPLGTSSITIPVGATGVRKDIRVQVTPPAGATTATLQIGVVEKSGFGKVVPGNAVTDMTVGTLPPTPEDRVRIGVKSLDPPAVMVGSKAQWKRNIGAVLTLVLNFTTKGTYIAEVELRHPQGWTGPNNAAPKLSAVNFPIKTATAAVPATIDVGTKLIPGTEATETDLIITVRSTDVTPPVNVKYAQAISVVN